MRMLSLAAWTVLAAAQAGTVAAQTADVRAPFVRIVDPKPAKLTSDTSAVLRFQADEPGCLFRTRLWPIQREYSAPAASTSISFTGLRNGAYILFVRAIDRAGNESVSAYYTWRVDTRYQPGVVAGATANSPIRITNLEQLTWPRLTPIPEGGTVAPLGVMTINRKPTGVALVRLRFKISATSTLQSVEMEWRQVTETWTGVPTHVRHMTRGGSDFTSPWVAPMREGAYRWRVRARDVSGRVSPWVEFGTPGNADVIVGAWGP